MRYLLLFILTGCTPLTQLEHIEREYRYFTAQENWTMCSAIYARSRKATRHFHKHGPKDRIWDLEDDLRKHDCKRLLGPAWADY